MRLSDFQKLVVNQISVGRVQSINSFCIFLLDESRLFESIDYPQIQSSSHHQYKDLFLRLDNYSTHAYVAKDREQVSRHLADFIYIVKYLVSEGMVIVVPRDGPENIFPLFTQKRSSTKYVPDDFLLSIARTIVSDSYYPTEKLREFIENNYFTYLEIFNKQTLEDQSRQTKLLQEQIESERRDRKIAQYITIAVPIVMFLISVVVQIYLYSPYREVTITNQHALLDTIKVCITNLHKQSIDTASLSTSIHHNK